MDYSDVLEELESLRSRESVEGMMRFGITPDHAYGVSLPDLRRIAKKAGKSHALAGRLWKKDARETRILAAMIDEPGKVTPDQVDSWASEFSYWEICDQCCMNLFWQTAFAYDKAVELSKREEEYVRRAGFALMAVLAWKDKKASDDEILVFLQYIKKGAVDERPMVKKAVNWALRQIGKRNKALNVKAVKVAEEILRLDSKSAKWIAKDALKELEGDAVARRLG
ncbi:MAG: DNA alkylation repair protein [Candidatus Altiarchaeota archaeon]